MAGMRLDSGSGGVGPSIVGQASGLSQPMTGRMPVLRKKSARAVRRSFGGRRGPRVARGCGRGVRRVDVGVGLVVLALLVARGALFGGTGGGEARVLFVEDAGDLDTLLH